ncbi:MAG TPA: 2-polyprenyl-3-methyl-6-methoxy-1,4-benzoquinone monooxygenase [Acidiferrobacterales bacterium]|jgi:ubiquinone biosynthesis monooxygenase Coq7
MTARRYTPFDSLIAGLDQALHTVFGPPPEAGRANPADGEPETELDAVERAEAARLMRVNHSGEVAAQALYQGQALTARLDQVRDKMTEAAQEENDHLAWTEARVRELGGHLSYLNPAWYLGSFLIGAAAGAAGDRWSLGFVAETEHQVVAHLGKHLARLPAQDAKGRAILEQMRRDEARHATVALEAGAASLPEPVKRLMALTSKVMTRTAYWI